MIVIPVICGPGMGVIINRNGFPAHVRRAFEPIGMPVVRHVIGIENDATIEDGENLVDTLSHLPVPELEVSAIFVAPSLCSDREAG